MMHYFLFFWQILIFLIFNSPLTYQLTPVNEPQLLYHIADGRTDELQYSVFAEVPFKPVAEELENATANRKKERRRRLPRAMLAPGTRMRRSCAARSRRWKQESI